MFDLQKAIETFERAGEGLYLRVMRLSGVAAMHEIGLSVDFNLHNQSVDAYLADRLDKFSNVNRKTVQDVQTALTAGVQAGETIDQLSKRVRSVFSAASKFRAQMIARTETISAANRGSLEAATASDEIAEKGWLHSQDSDVRSEPYNHFVNEVVPLDDMFRATGEPMPHPGGGSIPANNINCRCTMEYKLK